MHVTENTLYQVVQQSQQAMEREQELNQLLTETSEQVCIVHELVIVILNYDMNYSL